MTALEVRKLSKNYPLNSSQWARLGHLFRPGAVRCKNGLCALRDVTFTIEQGEAFGIVGANGSGKSTLLQIVAGILRPTSGTVAVHGRLSALLELGSGFSPEFTGRQNVYMNASILGLTREEIDERFDTIARFASIGDFIDQPIRTYSTGMVLRLAFSVVAHVNPEILIVDEALAVGDIAFRQRCMRKIHDLRAAGTTILFVSHDTADVKALCERCLWLDGGIVKALGAADEVVGAYLSFMTQREHASDGVPGLPEPELRQQATAAPTGSSRYGSGRAAITNVELVKTSGGIVLRIGFRVYTSIAVPVAGFLVRNEKGETIFGSNTAYENYPLSAMNAGDTHTVDFHWTMPDLAAGRYFISVAVSEGTVDEFEVCDYIEDSIVMDAPANGHNVRGYLHLPCSAVAVQRH